MYKQLAAKMREKPTFAVAEEVIKKEKPEAGGGEKVLKLPSDCPISSLTLPKLAGFLFFRALLTKRDMPFGADGELSKCPKEQTAHAISKTGIGGIDLPTAIRTVCALGCTPARSGLDAAASPPAGVGGAWASTGGGAAASLAAVSAAASMAPSSRLLDSTR